MHSHTTTKKAQNNKTAAMTTTHLKQKLKIHQRHIIDCSRGEAKNEISSRLNTINVYNSLAEHNSKYKFYVLKEQRSRRERERESQIDAWILHTSDIKPNQFENPNEHKVKEVNPSFIAVWTVLWIFLFFFFSCWWHSPHTRTHTFYA